MAALLDIDTYTAWWNRFLTPAVQKNLEEAREPVIWWTVAIAVFYPASYLIFRFVFPKIHNTLAKKKDHFEIMSRATSVWAATWLGYEGIKATYEVYPNLDISGTDWTPGFLEATYAQIGYMIVDSIATVLICLFVKGTFKHDSLFLWHHLISVIGFIHCVTESHLPVALIPMIAGVQDITSVLLSIRWWLIISDTTALVVPLSLLIMPVFWIVRPVNNGWALYQLYSSGQGIYDLSINAWIYMWVISGFLFCLNSYWSFLMLYRAYQVATGTAKHSQADDGKAANNSGKKSKSKKTD